MSLSLLAPGALALGLLVALPLLAHLSWQRPRDRVAFGAMLLMERVVKRIQRHRRVKDPLIFALRALALLALALAAAAPQWVRAGVLPDVGGSGRVVVLLDRSLSMKMADGGASVFAHAVAKATAQVQALPAGTRVGLVAVDGQAVALTPSLTEDRATVVAALGALVPGSASTDLGAGFREARRLLAGDPGEVLLYSDEAGANTVSAARPELQRLLAAGAAVLPQPVREGAPNNVVIRAAIYGDGLEGGQVTLQIAHFGPEPTEVACEVVLPDGQAVPIFVALPADGEATAQVTVPREAEGGVGQARCEDAALPDDDTRYFHLPHVGASRVLVVDGDPGDSPARSEVYFLEKALAPWGGGQTGVTADVVPPSGLAKLDKTKHRLVFLANVGDLRGVGGRLVDFVRGGGSVVLSMGSNVAPRVYNDELSALLPAPLRGVRSLAAREEAGVPLQTPTSAQGLLAPFAASGRAGFGRVRAQRVMTLDPYADTDEVRTWLRFEGGAPALVEKQVGRGRVLLWTSSFDFDWTNLPVQAVFMPLIQAVVAELGADGGGRAERVDAEVGGFAVVPLPGSGPEPEVFDPAGRLVSTTRQGGALRFPVDQAGAYRVAITDGPVTGWVAANLPFAESDVRAPESIERAEVDLDPGVFTEQVELGGWLLGLALACFALSAWLARAGGSA